MTGGVRGVQGGAHSRYPVAGEDSDDVLGFLLQTATEITARIQLEPSTKTVKRGALWYEEALPAETVLTGLLVASPEKAEAAEVFTTVSNLTKTALQIGGNVTVGRGLCQLRLI